MTRLLAFSSLFDNNIGIPNSSKLLLSPSTSLNKDFSPLISLESLDFYIIFKSLAFLSIIILVVLLTSINCNSLLAGSIVSIVLYT